MKIGRISYLNLFPVFYGLRKTGANYLYMDGYPAMVNGMLRRGEVDASPSSSIVYLKNPGEFEYIEGHSITSEGPVRSILLFSQRPVETLDGSTVGVTHQTETSAALLQIVLRKFYGLGFRPEETRLPARDAVQKFGAYLSIGDDALLADKERLKGNGWPAGCAAYDLGAIWHEKTGLPFVFALWIARRDWALKNHGEVERLKEALDTAKAYATARLEDAANASPLKDLDPAETVAYWECLHYGLDDNAKKGLELFRSYALELGLL
ncbi:MAG: menaquinone biosynthesis protein [Nitrospiraceae bacterium]|nr:menaquinone biosynthesis protein [Nitrospiraceae bacterium]